MKFKPYYLYGILFLLVIIFLVVVSNQSGSDDTVKNPVTQKGNIPDDDIHKPLKSGDSPSKENVSAEFKHRVEMLKKAIEENPNDTTSLREYADLLTAAHMQQESLEYYKRIIKLDPNRIDILFSLSFIYYSLGDMKNAESYTNRILDIDPENANALYNLGAISATNGDTKKAKEIWTKLYQKYPDTEIGKRSKNSVEKL
jgi:cytochrome c-type biogenesis protein CcmH/NrfG